MNNDKALEEQAKGYEEVLKALNDRNTTKTI